jgi:hypothetical protein
VSAKASKVNSLTPLGQVVALAIVLLLAVALVALYTAYPRGIV